MRIIRIGADDYRFRSVDFHAGTKLNLLIADKTRASGVGDSRNGTGKTAMALIVRYLFGGNKPTKLARATELANYEFSVYLRCQEQMGILSALLSGDGSTQPRFALKGGRMHRQNR